MMLLRCSAPPALVAQGAAGALAGLNHHRLEPARATSVPHAHTNLEQNVCATPRASHDGAVRGLGGRSAPCSSSSKTPRNLPQVPTTVAERVFSPCLIDCLDPVSAAAIGGNSVNNPGSML